jgi:hypothetical protein
MKGIGGDDQVADRAPHELVRVVAEDAARSRIERLDDAAFAQRNDAVGHVLQDGPAALLALLEALLAEGQALDHTADLGERFPPGGGGGDRLKHAAAQVLALFPLQPNVSPRLAATLDDPRRDETRHLGGIDAHRHLGVTSFVDRYRHSHLLTGVVAQHPAAIPDHRSWRALDDTGEGALGQGPARLDPLSHFEDRPNPGPEVIGDPLAQRGSAVGNVGPKAKLIRLRRQRANHAGMSPAIGHTVDDGIVVGAPGGRTGTPAAVGVSAGDRGFVETTVVVTGKRA